MATLPSPCLLQQDQNRRHIDVVAYHAATIKKACYSKESNDSFIIVVFAVTRPKQKATIALLSPSLLEQDQNRKKKKKGLLEQNQNKRQR
jgi:hypothetical protein